MLLVEIKPLLRRLNQHASQGLEGAAGLCVNRGNYEVSIEHWLLKMLDNPQSDLPMILKHYEIEVGAFKRCLNDTLEIMNTGNTGRPVISPTLFDLVQDAWLLASIDFQSKRIRSGIILLVMLVRYKYLTNTTYQHLFKHVNRESFANDIEKITASSIEAAVPKETTASMTSGEGGDGKIRGEGEAISKYCEDITAKAKKGKIDPVFGRDHEIRQMVDVLVRRRKNNPILVGEPGVGKTAVVEGLAKRIAEGDVPEKLKNVIILNLDIALLEAGASMKGEFEERLKGVIEEVKASEIPIILFIDEAHMIIGAGGAAGGSDAANILKPALARGELRTIAATTWAEYKKYFEKDAALERRFLPIKLEEPSVEATVLILRGLKARYEEAHGVVIRDESVIAAADLAKRFISGRFLPDKAIDLMDTSSGRISVSLSSKPAQLEDAERSIQALEREKAALAREEDYKTHGEVNPRIEEIEEELTNLREDEALLRENWDTEMGLVKEILAFRQEIENIGKEDEVEEGADGEVKAEEKAAEEPTTEEASIADQAQMVEPLTPAEEEAKKKEIKAKIKKKEDELAKVQGDDPLIQYEVTADLVARIISDWTGVPLGKLLRDESSSMLHMADRLKETIRGQDNAIEEIAEGLKAAKAGLKLPDQPMGVFLLVGPSGVGKTETALSVADTLFGGRQSLVTINMTEFQEKHSVSRLIGSPPGYVGYGEGGMLTEAVRQKPYSVVLLDEVEKANLDVMNLFYQVFDKGTLSDGEGRDVNFKNTVIFLTSNLGSEEIVDICDPDFPPSNEKLIDTIYPVLSQHFKPALLNRMTMIPYLALTKEALRQIASMKISGLQERMALNSGYNMVYTPAALEAVVDACQRSELGARSIDTIINRQIVPELSSKVLESMGSGEEANEITVDLDEAGKFVFHLGQNKEKEQVKKKKKPRKKKQAEANGAQAS